MGSGGYRSAIPKWQNLEAEITAKGIIPETIEKNWPQRAKNWFYAHGGSLDLDTGKLIFGQKIERATQRLARLGKKLIVVLSSPTERRMN